MNERTPEEAQAFVDDVKKNVIDANHLDDEQLKKLREHYARVDAELDKEKNMNKQKKPYLKVGIRHHLYAPNVEGAEKILRAELDNDVTVTGDTMLQITCEETDIGYIADWVMEHFLVECPNVAKKNHEDMGCDICDGYDEYVPGWEELVVPSGVSIQVDQGWNEESLAVLYAEFIHEQGLVDELAAFLWRKAQAENEAE